jgi:nuclear pore complex protein Nup205
MLTHTDIEGGHAIDKHYDLLVSLMRVICAAVVSRGLQNQQVLDQGRIFLQENRPSIVAVLKKSAGIGAEAGISGKQIGDLADSYILLMSITGYIDVSKIPHQGQIVTDDLAKVEDAPQTRASLTSFT